MKISIIELRNMVADAIVEAKKGKRTKEVPQRTAEVEAGQRERQVRSLPGYAHSDPLDFSKPLGPANVVKRQGASGIGGWTSESKESKILNKIREMQVRKLVRMIVAEEIGADE